MRVIALTADWQFQQGHTYSHLRGDGRTTRLQDQVDCWHWAVDESVKRGCNTFAVIGDMSDDRESVDLPVIDAMCECVRYAAERMEVWMLPGNHDSYLRVPSINALPMFAGVARVFSTPEVVDGVGLLPWSDDWYALQSGAEGLLASGAKYLLSHFMVAGSVPHGKGVPLDMVPFAKFKKVYLGDIHTPMTIPPNIRYVGSPMQLDYRDAGSPRGFVVFRPDKPDTYIENTKSPRFVIAHSTDEVGKARPEDFVRVACETDEDTMDCVQAAAAKGVTWIDTTRAVVKSAPPRLSVHSNATYAETFTAYVNHRYPEADEEFRNAVVEEALFSMAVK